MIFIVLLLFSTQAFAEEVEGKDAKNIVLTGEVMGAHLIDEKNLKMIGAKAGTFFSVKSGGKIYNCFFTHPGGYFCESLD